MPALRARLASTQAGEAGEMWEVQESVLAKAKEKSVMATNDNWTRSHKEELRLRKRNVRFKQEMISLSDVNWSATTENCGRLGKSLNSETVDDYAFAMKHGAVFPMGIVCKTPAGILIIAGIHRYTAAKKSGMSTVMAYVADVSLPHMFRLLAAGTNRDEGQRTSHSEAMEEAIYLVTICKLDVTDVCQDLHLNPKKVRERLRLKEIKKQAVEAGSAGAAHLSDRAMERVATLATNSKVLAAACDYLKTFKPSEEDGKEIIKKTKAAKTEAQQLAVIEQETAKRTKEAMATGGPTIVLPTRTKVIRWIHSGETVFANLKSLTDCQIVEGSDEAKELEETWHKLAKIINKFFSRRSAAGTQRKGTA